jgi:hypothetical protein
MPNPDPHPTPAENTSPVSRIVEGRPGVIEGDIDQRMAALLRDHQEMGARPKQEPVSVDVTTDGRNSMPASMTKAPKKAAKKKSK